MRDCRPLTRRSGIGAERGNRGTHELGQFADSAIAEDRGRRHGDAILFAHIGDDLHRRQRTPAEVVEEVAVEIDVAVLPEALAPFIENERLDLVGRRIRRVLRLLHQRPELLRVDFAGVRVTGKGIEQGDRPRDEIIVDRAMKSGLEDSFLNGRAFHRRADGPAGAAYMDHHARRAGAGRADRPLDLRGRKVHAAGRDRIGDRRALRRALRLEQPRSGRRLLVDPVDSEARCEPHAQQLASGVLRQVVHVDPEHWPLGGRQMPGKVRGKRFEIDAPPRTRDDHAAHGFAQHVVRNGEGQRGKHIGMADQHVFDFRRGDRFTAALDHVLAAPDDVEEAVRVEAADVAGVEPAFRDRRFARPQSVLHDARKRRAAQHDAPGDARRRGLARIVEDADVRPEDAPARPLALEPVVERGAGDGHTFGHAVTGQDRRVKPRAQSGGRRREQVARRIADEPQPMRRIRASLAFLEDAVMHRRRRVVPVEAGAVVQLVPEDRRVEAVGVNHPAARQQGRVEITNDAAHVKQRHHVVAAILRPQFQRGGDAGRAHAQVAQADGHALLAPGGPGREQFQRRVVRSVEPAAIAT